MFKEIALKYGCEKPDYGYAYDEMLGKFRNKPIRILEIGVSQGASLEVWREYFPKSEIVGVDIDPNCKKYADKRAKVLIGDQADQEFLKTIEGDFDVIIDDGGHHCFQHVFSFGELWSRVKVGGYYIIEDLHTAYWDEYGGNREGTSETVKMIKDFVDKVNGNGIWFRNQPQKQGEIGEIHCYNSIIFIKKYESGNNGSR